MSSESVYNWLMVLLNLERLFVLSAPMLARRVITERLVLIGCALIYIYSCIICSSSWVVYNVVPNPTFRSGQHCRGEVPHPTLTWIHLLTTYCNALAYPVILTFILSLILGYKILLLSKGRKEILKQGGDDMKRKETAAAMELFVLSTVHSSLYLPRAILITMYNFNKQLNFMSKNTANLIYICGKFFIYLSTLDKTWNFYFYIAKIKHFRVVMLSLFCVSSHSERKKFKNSSVST